MKKTLFTLVTLSTFAAPAFAQSTLEDTDGNGSFSYAELAISYPSLTSEAFMAMDTDESGELSPDELSAGLSAGLLEL